MENKKRIEKLQQLLQRFADIPYKGVYLWKYMEYEMTSGIIMNYQEYEKNVAIQGGLSDIIPNASQDQMDQIVKLLEGLEETEILFGMIPIRRMYKGKLEHTAMDAYVSIIEDSKYLVIEPDLGGQEDEAVYTRNRKRFSPVGVIGYYGQEQTDKNELIEFLVRQYIFPIEQAFQIKMPQEIVLRCVYKASIILKERRAYLNFYEEVLERTNPKVICYTHGPDPVLCFLYEVAQKKGIPTVEIEHGGLIRNLIYPKTLAYSDYYLTHSELITKPMLEYGYKDVYTVGKPGIYSETERDLKEGMPIVVSFISSLEKSFLTKALNLAKRLDKQKFLVVFKMHSSENWEIEEVEKILQENENWQFLNGTVDVRDLFAISDIVVGVRSSGILDALPFQGIKIITLEDENEKELLVSNLSFFHKLDELGDIVMAENEDQLYQEVMTYRRGNRYRNVVNHYWPENAEKLFTDFMEKFLN